jgi:tRNA-2-methylthio-N6-dimethylallyladenosine synthase
MTDDLLQAVRDLPRVARYLHVPAQSGCDEVLKRMKRMYSVALYDDMMARIRETVPGCCFCGETEESFRKSVELVERARFKNSFIFKYSPRAGTKADALHADDVPDEVKKRRNNDLLAVQTAISQQDNRPFIGRTVEVLVEGPSKAAAGRGEAGEIGQMTGRTSCDRIVVFEGHGRQAGRLLPVEIVDASAVTLFGQVVTAEVVSS